MHFFNYQIYFKSYGVLCSVLDFEATEINKIDFLALKECTFQQEKRNNCPNVIHHNINSEIKMTWEHQFLELIGKKKELGHTHQRIPKVNLEEQVKI